jgi:phage terminase large subunit-like protein
VTQQLQRFERFCSRVLDLHLEDFQRLILREYFAGTRELLVLVPRGNGKTTLAAALSLYSLCTSDRPAIYCAAASRDQARLLFDQAKRFASHPLLADRVTPRFSELRVRDGFMRVISSDAPRQFGLQPTLVLCDELHAWPSDALYVALRTALGKREGAQLVTITTAGWSPHESALERLRNAALALPQVERRESLTRAYGDAFTMLEWSADPDADLSDPAELKKANPASFVSEDFLREQINSPGLHPLEVARYHGNVFTANADSWLSPGTWQACAGDSTINQGERVHVAVDCGGERSASAVTWCTDDLRVGVETWTGDRAVLEVAAFVPELAQRFDVVEVAADPFRLAQAMHEWSDQGIPVIEFPQSNARLVEATSALTAAVIEQRLTHPNDPTLNRHVSACVVRQSDRGLRIDKARSRDQVDAAVALAMVVQRASAPRRSPVLLGWL